MQNTVRFLRTNKKQKEETERKQNSPENEIERMDSHLQTNRSLQDKRDVNKLMPTKILHPVFYPGSSNLAPQEHVQFYYKKGTEKIYIFGELPVNQWKLSEDEIKARRHEDLRTGEGPCQDPDLCQESLSRCHREHCLFPLDPNKVEQRLRKLTPI